jgi:dihydrofolate reductase
MRKLTVFNHMTLDGYFADSNGDMSWAHRQDPEWNEFVTGNAAGGGMLLFGRVTYQMMASFWPTPAASQAMPAVAQRMNSLPKVVFSRTLSEAVWQNTKLVKDDLAAAVRRLKGEPGGDMVVLGSGSIVAQLAQAGLVDEFQVVLNPLVLGQGKSMFSGAHAKLTLLKAKTRTFGNGNMLLCYEPLGVGAPTN